MRDHRAFIGATLCAGALALGFAAGRLIAQGMIVGGSALDSNLMVGSGGFNARTSRPMAMQRDVYTVQDGRMQYNEANAFAQPRYVPVGREGQAQASRMIYGSREAPVASRATPTSPSAAFRGYRSSDSSDLFTRSQYTPGAASAVTYPPPQPRAQRVASDPSYARQWTPPPSGVTNAPAPGYSSSQAVRASVLQRPAADTGESRPPTEPPPVANERYRVPGVTYGVSG